MGHHRHRDRRSRACASRLHQVNTVESWSAPECESNAGRRPRGHCGLGGRKRTRCPPSSRIKSGTGHDDRTTEWRSDEPTQLYTNLVQWMESDYRIQGLGSNRGKRLLSLRRSAAGKGRVTEGGAWREQIRLTRRQHVTCVTHRLRLRRSNDVVKVRNLSK